MLLHQGLLTCPAPTKFALHENVIAGAGSTVDCMSCLICRTALRLGSVRLAVDAGPVLRKLLIV